VDETTSVSATETGAGPLAAKATNCGRTAFLTGISLFFILYPSVLSKTPDPHVAQ
jgi:hypothetical protein